MGRRQGCPACTRKEAGAEAAEAAEAAASRHSATWRTLPKRMQSTVNADKGAQSEPGKSWPCCRDGQAVLFKLLGDHGDHLWG